MVPVYLYGRAKDLLPTKTEFASLAFGRVDGSEMIFEVYVALHGRLDAFLAEHSG